MPRKRISAGELAAKLSADPAHQQVARKRDREVHERLKNARIEQADLIHDLSRIGIEVEFISDLINSTNNYKAAVPVLLHHLSDPGRCYSAATREAIIRSLSFRGAGRQANELLIRLFSEETDNYLRWVIGNALAETATKKFAKQICGLLQDTKFGDSRNMLSWAVVRCLKDEAVPYVLPLLEEQESRAIAIEALGWTKSPDALEAIIPYTSDPDSWVRNKAKRAAAKIQRKLGM